MDQENDGLELVRLFYPVIPEMARYRSDRSPQKGRRRYFERHSKGTSFRSGSSGGCKSSLEFSENGLSLGSSGMKGAE